jgi:predicted Zn-dependent peptidase
MIQHGDTLSRCRSTSDRGWLAQQAWRKPVTEQLSERLTAPEPARARAVFSSEDFALLRTAVLHHLRANQDDPDSVKYSNLYHRLGRLG